MNVTDICFITLISMLDACIETHFFSKSKLWLDEYEKRRDKKTEFLLKKYMRCK